MSVISRLLLLGLLVLISFPMQAVALDKADQLMSSAVMHSKRNNHNLAIQMSGQALQLRPYDLNLIYQQASVWGRGGYYMKAIEKLTMVIREDELATKRRFPAARKFRAECYAALGQLQKAVEDYNVLLRRGPQNGKIWYYMAETLAVMGRIDWAMQAINRGVATDSHWEGKLKSLRKQILSGKTIVLHKPFSN